MPDTRRLFTAVRRFVRSHRAEAGRWVVTPAPDGPPEFRMWAVQVYSPHGDALDLEGFLPAREVAGWLALGRWLVGAALATVEAAGVE